MKNKYTNKRICKVINFTVIKNLLWPLILHPPFRRPPSISADVESMQSAKNE